MRPRGSVTRVDKSQARSYLNKANGFKAAAEALLAQPTVHGSAIAVLCTTAAIAYSDAVTIHFAGVKSKGEHKQAAKLLSTVTDPGSAEDKLAIGHFTALLSRKDQIAYADDSIPPHEGSDFLKRLQRFADWAERRLYHI